VLLVRGAERGWRVSSRSKERLKVEELSAGSAGIAIMAQIDSAGHNSFTATYRLGRIVREPMSGEARAGRWPAKRPTHPFGPSGSERRWAEQARGTGEEAALTLFATGGLEYSDAQGRGEIQRDSAHRAAVAGRHATGPIVQAGRGAFLGVCASAGPRQAEER
jgi:hypothetical protein